MNGGFWKKLERPILALSPMDGVTDAPFRFISAKYGRPDIHFTEFTNVEGLARNAQLMLGDFIYAEIERPVVAQIYGSEPESFFKVAVLVCELGFDGIDINMGCPAKNVASRGCGAALIRNPPLAKEIIRAVKAGVAAWVNGISAEDLGLKPRMAIRVRRMNRERMGMERMPERSVLPVSVKTRIGYDKVVIEDWVQHLLEEEPVAISIHGRTLKQMYTGSADWEAIARAAEIIHQTPSLVLGNGDLKLMEEVVEKVRMSGTDGALLGRGVLGNPWIFRDKEEMKRRIRGEASEPAHSGEVGVSERFQVLLEHCRYFEQVKGVERFSAMRKHFGYYCKGFPGAAEMRGKMYQTKSSQDVEKIINEFI